MTTDGHTAETIALDVVDLAKVIVDVGLDAMLDELIARLAVAIGEYDPSAVDGKIRTGFHYEHPELGLIEWMPAMRVGSTVSVKTVGYHPTNPAARLLPSVLSTTALYDTTSGHLRSICESTLLTALRTGAASALVTDVLAIDAPIRIGVVGAGAQAVTQVHAIGRVRELTEVIVTDIDGEVAGTFAQRLPDYADRIRVTNGTEFSAAVPILDVLCTCTSVAPGAGPVVDLQATKSNLHVNAVGADFPGKTELPVEFLRAAVVIPDVTEQCLVEGESQRLKAADLGPDMVSLLQNQNDELAQRVTVFDSTGWAFEDLIAAELFADHADRLELGRRLQFVHNPIDPYDPYEAVRF